MQEKLLFTDHGAQADYDRVLTTKVDGCQVTVCFLNLSHGKNLENIERSLKDAYAQRVKNWS